MCPEEAGPVHAHPRLQVQVHDHHNSPKITPFIMYYTSQRFRAGRLVFSPRRTCSPSSPTSPSWSFNLQLHQPQQDYWPPLQWQRGCRKHWQKLPTISKCFQMTAKVDKNCKIRSNVTKVDKCWQKLPKLETSAVYVMYQMHFLLKSHKDANILFNRTACQEIKLNIFQHFNCSCCEGSSPKRPP